MLKDSIHGLSSVNWKPPCCGLKPAYSGSVTAKPRTAPSSALTRAACGPRSPPVNSTATPAMIGVQMARLSKGNPCIIWSFSSGSAHVRQRQQQQHADDHREGIVVDIARLQLADHRGEPADQPRR